MELIKLKHVKNFRDLGGVKTKDGKTVRTRMLIRGTTLFKLSDDDIKTLKEDYKLKTVIDLRTKKESLEKPDAVVDGVKYFHMPIFNEAVAGISHEKKIHSIKSLVMMPTMEDMYVKMVTDDCLDNLIEILRTILTMPNDDYSVLFHCTVGKDRTGIIAALILAFLGVDRNIIIQDYVYSNRFTVAKARFVYFACLLIKFSHKFAKKVKNSLMAKQSFIESSLGKLEENYGSLEAFFIKKLNFTSEETEAIKAKFLV